MLKSNAEQNKIHKQMTIPVFIPHLGCGHACTFCNQRTISGVAREMTWSEAQLKQHIETWLNTADHYDHIEIGFFGGSFTGISESLQESYLRIGKSYLDTGRIQGIRLSTRPDYLEAPVIARLKTYGVTLVELGVQSFSNEVLTACKRGHDTDAIENAIGRLKEAEIDFGIQLMLGLPEDNAERFLESVRKTIALNPSCVRLYPTLVLTGTELASNLEQGEYVPLSIDGAVVQAADAYELFLKAGIPVIRMGLQASESLSEEAAVLAGPHHDAFRTLVETELYRRLMERDLENGLPDTRLCVRVHPKHVCFFSGHKQSNIKWLKDKGIQIDKVIKDDAVALYQIQWVENYESKR